MSDANLSTIAFGAESEFGTKQTDLQQLRFTGESLSFEKETVSSAEIRSDRQVSDMQKVHAQPSGGFDFELSYRFILPILALALHSEWETINITVADSALDHTTQTITGTDFTGIKAGMLVKVTGLTVTGDNGWKRCISRTANSLTFAAGSFTQSETISLDYKANSLSNGTSRKSATFEKKILDAAGEDYFQRYIGMTIDTLALSIDSKAIITGSVGAVGASYEIGDATIDGDGYDPPASGEVMNGTNNIGSITMDGETAEERFKSLSIDIANNVRGKDAMGVEGNWDVGLGQFKLTGNIGVYFRDNTMPIKIKDHATFSISFSVQDAEGNQLHFYMPAVKLATGDPAVTAINTDVMIDAAYEAIRGTDAQNPTGKTLIIDAVAAADA